MADERKTNVPSGEKASAFTQAAAAPGADAYGVEDCCVRTYWAVVERDGTFVRGRNVWRVERLATGIYEVFFTGDVSNGAFVATIGRPGIATEPAGMISVALRCCTSTQQEENKGVWVDTHDPDGSFADRSFHLVVHTQHQP